MLCLRLLAVLLVLGFPLAFSWSGRGTTSVRLPAGQALHATHSTRSKVTMHFDEAGSGSSEGLLERTRYIATNRFNVRAGKEAQFEKRWATRKSRLGKLDGFRFFSLLRKKSIEMGGSMDTDDTPNYISFTIWQTKENFDTWRTGEAFKEAHGGGGIGDFLQLLTTALFILKGKPNPAFYDAILPKIGASANEKDLNIVANSAGWRDVHADGENLIAPDILVAQDRFSVKDDLKKEFEEVWAKRETALSTFPGFVAFFMQRRDATKADDAVNYIATSVWKDQQAYEGFKEAMMQKAAAGGQAGGGGSTKDMLLSPPKIVLYEGKLALLSSQGP